MPRTESKVKRSLEGNLKVMVEAPGLPMDIEETCEGVGYSPEIRIEGLEAPFIAVILDEAESEDSPSRWVAWNISATEVIPRNLPKSAEVDEPIYAIQGRNDLGDIGYSEPCPGKGETHHYVFRIFGLDKPLDLNPASTKKDLKHEMKDHVVQYGEAVVTYTGTGELTQAKRATVEEENPEKRRPRPSRRKR